MIIRLTDGAIVDAAGQVRGQLAMFDEWTGGKSWERHLVDRAIHNKWVIDIHEMCKAPGVVESFSEYLSSGFNGYGMEDSHETNTVVCGDRGEAYVIRTCSAENFEEWFNREPTMPRAEFERQAAEPGTPCLPEPPPSPTSHLDLSDLGF